MGINEIILIAVSLFTAFLAGLIIGGFGALKCVKFGIRASYEIRTGNQGLFESDEADAELAMLDEKEKNGNQKQQ
jgi:hypothetical protein